MNGIPESKKPRVTSGIDNMIDECSKWYHNTQEWYEDSWDSGVSCNEQIRNEMNKVEEAYEQLQKQNQELIKALEFYADGDNWEHIAPDKVDYRVIEKSDFGIGEFQLTELTDDEWVGGRRAREVLAKYQKGDL